MEWCKTQYGNDLGKLAELIRKYDTDYMFQKIDSALYKVQGKVTNNPGSTIVVDTGGIELILKKKMSGTIPNDLDSVTIYLEVRSDFDLSIDIDLHDRIFDTYKFQIEVKGVNSQGDHYNAWHLDKDIRQDGDNAAKVEHPLYHFQAGGNTLEDKSISGAIFLGAPRLPHPPMDVILGVHFILKNFCSTKDYGFLNKLFYDYDYEDLIQRAKDRMFKPYFQAFVSNNNHQDFKIENVFPLAV